MTSALDATVPAIIETCPYCECKLTVNPEEKRTAHSYCRCLNPKCGMVWSPERPPEKGASAEPKRRPFAPGDWFANKGIR